MKTNAIKGKLGDTWNNSKSILALKNGLWVSPKAIYTRRGVKWVYVGVPPNMVVLYDGTPPIGNVCDGTKGTPNLLNQFVSGSDTPLTLSGNATHDGTSHGSVGPAFSLSTFGHSSGGNPNGDDAGAGTTTGSHGHSVSAAHSHGGVVNNADIIDKYKLIPTINAAYIGTNAVFFNIYSITSSGWSSLAVTAKYLYLTSTNGLADGTAHTHNSATGTSTSAVMTTGAVDNSGFPFDWPTSHRHDIPHSMTGVKLTPKGRQLLAYKYSGAAEIFESDLPSGTIALFTSNDMPIGWSRYLAADGKLICLGDSVVDIGSDAAHGHPSAVKTSSAVIAAASVTLTPGTGIRYWIPGHTHTWTDNHSGTVSSLPPNVSLIIGVKE